MTTTHVVIPDTQIAPGVPTDHLRWAGRYIVEELSDRDDVKIIHLGDHWDMPSLSSWDARGSKNAEGRRIIADIDAGNAGLRALTAPLLEYNATRRARKERQWRPELWMLRGNHEERIERAINGDPKLDGFLSYKLFNDEELGWRPVPFLQPLYLDGVGYAHYWINRMTGKPLGGMVGTRLKTLGHSFTMGHQQTYDVATHYTGDGRQIRGLVAGAFYLHDEDYKGPQGNAHWRGMIICNDVQDGAYNLLEVDLAYLCRRYEGVELDAWKAAHGL